MPEIILHILSIIGILLLVLLGMLVLLLVLILFWPVTYRVKGEKTSEDLRIDAKADWLAGLFRVRYTYPEPGKLTIKLIWKTLTDADFKKGKAAENKEDQAGGEQPGNGGDQAGGEQPGNGRDQADGEQPGNGRDQADGEQPGNKEGAAGNGLSEAAVSASEAEEQSGEGAEPGSGEAPDGPFAPILGKIQKIKYTILKIYDKMKEVWANITYYHDLLHEENTVLLWRHVKLRLWKILKSIRPRHIRADVLFGTGAPDTTGYVFGVYGMLLPVLGRQVYLTPDFNRAVLEGNLDVSGHITLWTLTWNALKLLLDKKLRLFLKKLKAGRKGNGR